MGVSPLLLRHGRDGHATKVPSYSEESGHLHACEILHGVPLGMTSLGAPTRQAQSRRDAYAASERCAGMGGGVSEMSRVTSYFPCESTSPALYCSRYRSRSSRAA